MTSDVPAAASTAAPIRVVAFGGGHGLAASLRALRRCAIELDLRITAVVTVGDDGGSSGRLRAQRGGLPPGDLRQALVALAGDDPVSARTAELLQHRWVNRAPPPGPAVAQPPGRAVDQPAAPAAEKPAAPAAEQSAARAVDRPAAPVDLLAGHAVGNLLLSGLFEMLDDPVAALDHAAALVRAQGRVLPMACDPVGIEADVLSTDPDRPGRVVTVRGQHAVAVTPGRVISVRLTPASPAACPQSLAAVREADWLIFGPGSWYTSVIPHLLVPQLAEAIVTSRAARLVTLNLAADQETLGLSLAGHLATLTGYLPGLTIDTVVADGKAVGDPEPVRRTAESLGARLVLAPVAVADGDPRHDPTALGAALVPVLGAAR